MGNAADGGAGSSKPGTNKRAEGIDVSHWKPVKDWNALTRAQISFVGAKATEGTTVVDKTLRQHRDGVRDHGLALGIYYHFARSGSPSAQAERFMDAVGPLRTNERLALDFEVMTTAQPEEGLPWIAAFIATLKQEWPDRRPILYTSKRIWRMIGDPEWQKAADVDLWVPRYNAKEEPLLPRPFVNQGWTFWQWSDGDTPSCVTPGVGRCDRNYFRGDVVELRRYAKTTRKPVAGELVS